MVIPIPEYCAGGTTGQTQNQSLTGDEIMLDRADRGGEEIGRSDVCRQGKGSGSENRRSCPQLNGQADRTGGRIVGIETHGRRSPQEALTVQELGGIERRA
jgi:hypothetical protein